MPSRISSASASASRPGGKRSVAARFAHTCQQRRRHHQKTDTETGEHRLGEGAEIGDPGMPVDPGERGQGRAGIAELAVVIVLDHPGPGVPRPAEQGDPPFHGHRHTGRELVGWRDIGELRSRRAAPPLLDHRARRRRPAPRQLRAHGLEQPPCRGIARILDPDAVARLQQGLRAQPQPLLRAAGDQDAAGIAAQPRVAARCAASAGAQLLAAARVAIAEIRPDRPVARRRRTAPAKRRSVRGRHGCARVQREPAARRAQATRRAPPGSVRVAHAL